ncbi:hybrid sensor histidine kinase/response regulator, partial [Aetokthonos hydrillicola]
IQKNQITLNRLRDLPLKQQNLASPDIKNIASLKFDALEMDEYTEFHLTLHEALEQTLQLQETMESLDLLLQQCNQTGEKKHTLLLNVIDALVKARMLPLSNIVNRFPQMVQNFAAVYGKCVEMKLNGTNVLIDKAIAEKLHDPLLHLVRNAFDHGIELPEVRNKCGKPEQGLIEICAYHEGNNTVIEVRDDGLGLNFEKIYNRAIELDLISDTAKANGYLASATQSELLEVLFEPGFSTAAKPSEISGRGIGLDIVRSQLQALDGEVSVKSIPQQGTTFILKIPFSMTTDKLMLVQAGGIAYALLLDSIVKILLPNPEQIKQFEGKRVLHWKTRKDERMVSVRKLSDLMCNGSSSGSHDIQNYSTTLDEIGKKIPPVLLLRHHQDFFALEVDHIIGEQELVIRPLGNAIAPPKYIYGCSSLANGTLILVVDTAVLIDSIEMPAVSNINMLPASYLFNKQPLLVSSSESQALLTGSSLNNSTKSHSNITIQSANASKLLLVVDDALSLRQTISLTLQKSGYQVVQAIDGLDAIEKLQQYPEISLVISDLEMPRMNGFEFLSHVRQASNSTTIPVVILTSRSSDKHQHFAQELGASAYLTKPYLEENLLGTVESLIQSD